MTTFNFTTGPSTLPDVGVLSYNNCLFSPLFETQVSAAYVKDAANRTVKEIEYDITADGYVTMPPGATNVESTLSTLEKLLSAPAGPLIYSGRSINISVNTGGVRDVAWGPLPELMDIQPLGNGGSAKVKWRVKVRVPPRVIRLKGGFGNLGPVLQFNEETTTSYDEAGYCSFSVRGTLEIPLTRLNPTSRVVSQTADDFRKTFMDQLLGSIDLTRFHWTKRDFTVSRDKRSLEFAAEAEELPWMAMPPGCTLARGTFTVRPAKSGMGLANWLCTLNCTYTVRKDNPRRLAWFAFLALLRERMRAGNNNALVPQQPGGNQNPNAVVNFGANVVAGIAGNALRFFRGANVAQNQQVRRAAKRNTWLVDFGFTEGLYLDSKTTTFTATWRLTTTFSEILLASGLWRKAPNQTDNKWAASVQDISGGSSWLLNLLDADVIVDFGS